MQIYIVAFSLGVVILFPLETMRRTFLYSVIKTLFYAKNFFWSTMCKENIKAWVTSLL